MKSSDRSTLFETLKMTRRAAIQQRHTDSQSFTRTNLIANFASQEF